MVFVLPALLFWGLVLFAVWFFVFRAAARQERTVADAMRRDARFNALLETEGEPLHCLACQKTFFGPLPANGCPFCHTRAFVIPNQTSDDPALRAAGARTAPVAASPIADTSNAFADAPQGSAAREANPADTRAKNYIGFRDRG